MSAEVARRLVDLSGRELDGGHTWVVGDVGPGEGLVRTLRVEADEGTLGVVLLWVE